MCKNRILGFACEYGCREARRRHCDYSSAWPVPPLEVSKIGEGYITRLVGDGVRSAAARDCGDEATAKFHRESVSKMRALIKAEFGDAVTADELFDCGYRAVRNA